MSILLVTLLSGLLVIPSVCRASEDEFFSCVDREGRVTVTNRYYDQRLYTCTPFAALNRQFRQARVTSPSPAPSHQPGSTQEASLAAESARMSAEAATVAMEAAWASAQAARQTAEAAEAIAPPFQIIRR